MGLFTSNYLLSVGFMLLACKHLLGYKLYILCENNVPCIRLLKTTTNLLFVKKERKWFKIGTKAKGLPG